MITAPILTPPGMRRSIVSGRGMTMCRLIAGLQLIGACGGAEVPAVRASSGTPSLVTRAPSATPPGGIAPPPATVSPGELTTGARRAMDNLVAIEVFALGPVGPGASPNLGESLTRALSQQSDAVEAFVMLSDHRNPVTRLYAYWALRTLAPDRARSYAAAIEADRSPIDTVSGCVGSCERVGALARRMEDPGDLLGRAMPTP